MHKIHRISPLAYYSNMEYEPTTTLMSFSISKVYYFKSIEGCEIPGLNVKEKPARILNHILDSAQEKHCLSPIDQSMIISKSKIHHGPWNN